ncbi:MAG: hypothetical protein GF329_06755 [Candidatus Lokiarchaeota archaeon]|nr:hypothetical protein [Candidatus Lokiarchaeota archaeon]
MIPSGDTRQRSTKQEKELITSNFEVSYYPEKIIIEVDKSDSSAIYLILLFFFFLDTMDLLVAIQIQLILLGIISIIIDLIIIVFMYSGYLNYKDLKVHWIFNVQINQIKIYRKSSRVDERDFLKFQDIEAITLSENLYLKNRFFVSCITINHKKHKICNGERKDCYPIAKKLSEFLNKPMIYRNFFDKALIISSSFLALFIILIFVFFFVISLPLIFDYVLYILLKTTIILTILRILYLLKEHIKAKNHYFKRLRKLT